MLRRNILLTSLAVLIPNFVLASEQTKTLKIGVTAGLHAQILEQVLPIAKKNGLNIKIVEFQDYVQPNAALATGDLDVNIFQTKPFLDAANRDRGYDLVPVGETITFPMAFYSKKYSNLSDLPNKSTLGIPNDPSQGGRALILLASQGLIKLKDSKNLLSSPLDIVSNPHHYNIIELEAAQLPRSLSDLDAAAINGNYASAAGLNPSKDGILIEDPNGPYVNHIVVRAQDKNQPWVKPLIQSYQQPQIHDFILKTFKGAVIPAF